MKSKNGKWNKSLASALAVIMVALTFFSVISPAAVNRTANAASSKITLNKRKATMYVNDTLRLKVKGTNKKVTWSSSNKKVATVNKKGVVKAKKKGRAYITAKVAKKKIRCRITVKKQKANVAEVPDNTDTTSGQTDTQTDTQTNTDTQNDGATTGGGSAGGGGGGTSGGGGGSTGGGGGGVSGGNNNNSSANNNETETTTKYISRQAWMNMLNDTFGVSSEENYGTENATGEYVALSAMKAIGCNLLSNATGDEELTDEELLALASDYEIVPADRRRAFYTQKDGEEAASKAFDLSRSETLFPDKNEIVYAEDAKVLDTTGASLTTETLSDGTERLTATRLRSEPKTGEYVILRKENGVAYAMKIESSKKLDDNSYQMNLSDVEDFSDVIESIDFSGTGNFDYMTGKTLVNNPKAAAYNRLIENRKTFNRESKKHNIDITFNMEASKSTDEVMGELEGNVEVEVDSVDVEIGKASDSESDIKPKKPSSSEGEVAFSAQGTVHISDFQLYAAGRILGSKNARWTTVKATGNASVSGGYEGSLSGKILLLPLELPLGVTPVSFIINIYLETEVDGSLTASFGFGGITASLEYDADAAEGEKLQKDVKAVNKTGPDLEAMIDITVQLGVQIGLVVLHNGLIIDPTFHFGAEATVSEERKTKKNMETGEISTATCRDITIAFPIYSIDIWTEDALLAAPLNKLEILPTYVFADADKASKIYNHYEDDENGKMVEVPQCTREDWDSQADDNTSGGSRHIPDDAVEFNGHYYKFYYVRNTWTDARQKCIDLGGHLVTITSQEEQDFIEKNVNDQYYAWLGGFRPDSQSDEWQWVTGEPWSYTNWLPNEPNNDKNENETRLQSKNVQWNDLNENDYYRGIRGYICEWDSLKDLL